MTDDAADGVSADGAYVRDRSDLQAHVWELDDDARVSLSAQTETVLEAHGRIQEEHRSQANRLLRAYVAGIGLLVAGLGALGTVIRQLSFPEIDDRTLANPEVLQALAAVSIALLGGVLIFRAFLRFAGTVEIVVQILTPEEIETDTVISGIFAALPFYPGEHQTEDDLRFRGEAREGIRRVVEADHLLSVPVHPSLSAERLLTEQLVRARQNEAVINYNMTQLSHIYELLLRSLQDVLFGTFVLAVGLLLLVTG
ncbi:hypothetical protein [Natronobiforma cellulositropha]|uniref:hypothetical protein n=1 Tax=Natronobiforma cellulositropha TaxID=1679076 RepID=UPI0021D5A4B5|nr:hypothetical protein [Natronobiforma cellulositropha]